MGVGAGVGDVVAGGGFGVLTAGGTGGGVGFGDGVAGGTAVSDN